MKNALPDFRSGLFWDTDITKIDWEKNAGSVIARTFMYGMMHDFEVLKNLYGWPRIQAELMQVRYLDQATLSFAANLFDIQKQDFRCFKFQQSSPTHSAF